MVEDSESEDDEFEYIAQVSAHAPSRIGGNIVDTRLAIDTESEKTGSSIGLIIEDPYVEVGSVWKNRNTPDGFDTIGEYNDTLAMANADVDDDNYAGGDEVTSEAIQSATERLESAGYDASSAEQISGTDYKVAAEDGNDVKTYNDDVIGIDVGGGTLDSEQRDEFDHDTVMVWYGGIVGQFIARTLDFNGAPFAHYNDEGYLVKGLLQPPIGWRNDDVEKFENVPTTDRSKLASPKDRGGYGRPPRIARPVVLREELDDTAEIELSWYDDAKSRRNFDGVFVDGEELDLAMAYGRDDGPDAVIEDALDVDNAADAYWMFHGEGWEDEVEVVEDDTDTSGGSFDMGMDEDVVDDGLTDREEEFAESVTEQLTGTGAHPDDEVFLDSGADIEGLVQHNVDAFDTDDPNVEGIRTFIIENLSHIEG